MPLPRCPAARFGARLDRQNSANGHSDPVLRTAGVVDQVHNELIEIPAAPEDLAEGIDVVILALDGAWRANGAPPDAVFARVSPMETGINCKPACMPTLGEWARMIQKK